MNERIFSAERDSTPGIKGLPLMLAAVMLAALVIRVLHFNGIEYSDDLSYAVDAHRMVLGCFHVQDNILRVRLGLIVPIALSFRLFGVHEWSMVIYPLLCSIALIPVIFLLGKLFFNEKAGLLASVLLAVFPLDVEYATKGMPDGPIAFWMALGLLFFFTTYEQWLVAGELRKKEIAGFLLSGVFLAMAYMVRDTGAIMLLYAALFLCLDLPARRPGSVTTRKIYQGLGIFACLLAGFFFVYVLEGFYYVHEAGDFFRRYHLVSTFYAGNEVGANQDLAFYPRVLFHFSGVWRFAGDDVYYPYGFFYYAIVPSLLAALLFGFRSTWPVVLWWLFLFSYHQFGSMCLTRYILIHRLVRHLSVITVPSLLILAWALVWLFSFKGRHRIISWLARGGSLLVLTGLLLSSLWSITINHVYNNACTYDARACYEVVRKYPTLDVFADIAMVMHLQFLDGYRNEARFRLYQQMVPEDAKKDRIIILDSVRLCVDDPPRFQGMIPEGSREPGPGWKLLDEIKGPPYDVWGRYNPRVYFVKGSSSPQEKAPSD